MKHRSLHDGRSDGLNPLESLDLARVDSFAELLRAMSKTAFSGRQLGKAFEILLEMAGDHRCRNVLTISGAMTVAKQGKLICDLIEHRVVNAVVATGALIAHGLTESIGLTHYEYDETVDDESLFDRGYNRIYDTLEMEANLNDVERLVRSVLTAGRPDGGVWSAARLCSALGKRLSQMAQGPGILRSAYEHDVPVFIPAFTDSEMGLDVSTWAMAEELKRRGLPPDGIPADVLFSIPAPFNPFLDLQQYSQWIGRAERLGILTIGGGVPRNWAQQVGPYYDITNSRLGTKLPVPRFQYGVRICPEPVHWGGLSGCTYSEGVSWGKFVPPDEGGRYAEVHADATAVWPLLVKALLEELSGHNEAVDS
ncbi:MAG: deoxyhypusine synthase family protein [Pirellulales bacterium]|nr:deoxyhypusine synthase family protein [Pirellulales bacterium]